MPSRFLIITMLLLGLSLKSQAQLHVMPKTWPEQTPQVRLKKQQAAWKRFIAQLEHERRLVLRKPKTEASRVEQLAIEAQIRSARDLAQRERVSPPVRLLVR